MAGGPGGAARVLAADMLGIQHDVTAEKAMRELGWAPRTLRASVIDTAESLISAGVVQPRKKAGRDWSRTTAPQ